MGTAIDEDIGAFLEERLGAYRSVEPLEGDASTRRYWRVRLKSGVRVLCRDSAFTGVPESEYPFLVVHGLLKELVPVPEIYATDSGRGLLLIQDLGDDLLEHIYPHLDTFDIEHYYRTSIDNLLAMQSVRGKGTPPFTLAFDVDKLMFEFDFFIEHALRGYFKAGIPDDDLRELRSEFAKIAGILQRPGDFVFAHRDYHSRNLIINDDTPYIIDFQDARMGLPQYDLASLLRDSYVTLEPDMFERLKNYYYKGAKEHGVCSMERDEFDYFFDIMAFQRNVKAIGTFGYQVSVKGNNRYERYIKPTIEYLPEYAERREELRKAWDIIGSSIIKYI